MCVQAGHEAEIRFDIGVHGDEKRFDKVARHFLS